jgi:hypothetical protein
VPDQVKPSHSGHREIHDDEVDPLPMHRIQRLAAAGRLGDVPPGGCLLERSPQSRADQRVVIHDEDSEVIARAIRWIARTPLRRRHGTPCQIFLISGGSSLSKIKARRTADDRGGTRSRADVGARGGRYLERDCRGRIDP